MEPMQEEDTKQTNTNESDPFAYLERNRFTSEKFKIEIRGLPKYYGLNEFKKLLNNKLNLKCSKIKPPKKRSEWLYACFRCEEDRQRAIETLSGYVWKNKTLSVTTASAVPDPLVKKRNSETVATGKSLDASLSKEDILKTSTIPLWNVPYEKQLQIKKNDIKNVLEQLTRQLLHENKLVKSGTTLEERVKKNNGIVCELLDIRHPPLESVNQGYRNKCEFTIGVNEETNLKTIGFRFGAYVDGSTNVGSVSEMPHVPEAMKRVVKVFEGFVRSSELKVYNQEDHSGFWKQLTVRVGTNTGDLMVIVGANADAVAEQQLQQIKRKIVSFFESEEGKCCEITSLYFQNTSLKAKKSDTEHLSGAVTITEKLCDLKFVISPSSFFQTNTVAAEILFHSISELIPHSKEVTLLDICCGTGTIGLCLAKKAAQVLGVESEVSAIENAKLNCVHNGIQNCEFFDGKAEDILHSVIHKSKHDDIIAIVDPPRAGLHKNAILQLRRTASIKKLIYVSCNPKAALKNFIDFGRRPSKTLLGNQFFPVKAIPVDLFPHTSHCELILYFERYEPGVSASVPPPLSQADQGNSSPSPEVKIKNE